MASISESFVFFTVDVEESLFGHLKRLGSGFRCSAVALFDSANLKIMGVMTGNGH